MPVGQCKLCLQQKELQESHLLPAAVYRLCRHETEEISDPITIRHDSKNKSFRVFQTSRQITGPVLCSDCEQLLNTQGESWVLPVLSSLEGFPLYEMLAQGEPEFPSESEELTAYYAEKLPAIRTDRLVHFGAAIFWKAAAHNWQTGHGYVRLYLGKYAAGLRKFVLGERFPEHLYLMVTIVPPKYPTISAFVPYESKIKGFYHYSFYVPGIEFRLSVGREVPDYLRACCIVTNPQRPIFLGKHTAEFIGSKFKEALETGRTPLKLEGRLSRMRGKKKA